MEENKGISLLVECENCKEKFRIENDKVTHKKEYKSSGQSIFLTYYDCPSCGRRHYVQIDDLVSLGKMKEVNMMFVKLSVLKQRGEEIPKKQLDKFKKARKKLNEYRMNLMKEYTNKSAIDENGGVHILRFSV